jgi:hypothetical protein
VPFLNFFSFLEGPTAIIVSAAILLLIISTVRDERQHRRRASRHREYLLTETIMHFRPNRRLGNSSLPKTG